MTRISNIANITKLAGFEHTKYIQGNCIHTKQDANYIPLFIGRTVKDGIIDTKFDWYIPLSLSEALPRSQLRKKCIVLPYVGSVGDLAIYDGSYPAHLGSNIAKIEEIDETKYLIEFIYFYLKSPIGQKKLLRDIQGGVQKNITMEAIRNIELPNIALREQRKIVSILSPIDGQIKRNNDMVHKLQVLSHAIFNLFFADETKLVSLVDFPYIEILKPGILPFEGTKHYIATAEVEGEKLNFSAPLIEFATRENRANMQPIPNSVWFAKMKRSLKHIYVTSQDDHLIDNYIFSTGFCGIKCDDIAFEYMINYLNLPYFEKEKDIISHGATMEGVNNEDLKSFKIHLPSRESLIQFHSKTKDIHCRIAKINEMTHHLTLLKNKAGN